MLIYRHHTVDDIIDLDDDTGRWKPVIEDRSNPIMVGVMPLAKRMSFEIRGSYTIENEKRYCVYWNDHQELVFRTDDARFVWFERDGDGGLLDLMNGATIDLQPATYGDGRAIPDMSVFSVTDSHGTRLLEVVYNSQRYLEYYLGNYTFAPDEDLSDWDFFIYVKREIEELRNIATARNPASETMGRAAAINAPIVIETGQKAPRAGDWAAVHHLDRRCWLDEGESAPDIDGQSESWVWVDR
jgi:hypothetical protein